MADSRDVGGEDLSPFIAELGRALAEAEDVGDCTGRAATTRFEKGWAELSGSRHAVLMASGSAARVGALASLGATSGDEIILAASCSPLLAAAARFTGATPRFADVADDDQLDPAGLEEACSRKSRIVVLERRSRPGQDIEPARTTAEDLGLTVLVDESHHPGSPLVGIDAGVADLEAGGLLLTAGPAGIVTTDVMRLADILRAFRNGGAARRADVVVPGWSGWPGLACAKGLELSFERLDARRRRCAEIRDLYGQGLADVPVETDDGAAAALGFPLRCDDASALVTHLQRLNIQAARAPEPVHLLPAWRHLGYEPGSFPRAEERARRTAILPLHPGLTDVQVERVIGRTRAFFSP